MATQQCPIYLDPWDKLSLEGVAMCVSRMANIADATYRGVTCQRWWVRFGPGLELVHRWLDVADQSDYVYPIDRSAWILFTHAAFTRDENSLWYTPLYVGQVQPSDQAGDLTGAVRLYNDAWVTGYSLSYRVTAKAGTPILSTVRARIIGKDAASFVMPLSTTIGGPYFQHLHFLAPVECAAQDRLTGYVVGTQGAGDSITFADVILSVEISWGTFA